MIRDRAGRLREDVYSVPPAVPANVPNPFKLLMIREFAENEVQAVWEKGNRIQGQDQNKWRQDHVVLGLAAISTARENLLTDGKSITSILTRMIPCPIFNRSSGRTT